MYFDILDVLSLTGLTTAAVVLYLLFVRKPASWRGYYNEPDWNYPLKLLWARYAVRQWKSNLSKTILYETPLNTSGNGIDSLVLRATAADGTALVLGIRKLCGRKPLVEVTILVQLLDGTIYRLPRHPQTTIGAWEDVADGWSGGGLKIQVVAPERLRIIYNGLLTKDGGQSSQHVKLNFIWADAARAVRFPEDWSNQLAADALARDLWQDGDFPKMLNSLESKSWLQWGAIQGRLEAHDDNGVVVHTEYLRLRGVKERNWGVTDTLRRSITLIASAPDGTAVQIRAMSFKNKFTQCISGCVRFPDCTVESITATDLQMKHFCETPIEVPRAYTINVSTRNRTLRLVIKMNVHSEELFSGVPCRRQFVLRTVIADINGYHGSGLLELGYETPEKGAVPSVKLQPPRYLKWLSVDEAGSAGYCVTFVERAATCPDFVGGKGASLALLASVQRDEGYRVPPGFCVTSKALEKQLQAHPNVMAAILKIEAANENYEEEYFKRMCTEASKLIELMEITTDVKQEVLSHMRDLRQIAMEEGFGPDLRFAVRSSAVGEDSEALSAAGQNETVLGCHRDEQVLSALKRCWASMFAFTSAYYRRANGQACVCGGGIVVQVLAAARAAGVLFTRLPSGDPARLLITANYGLGESVVSGAVEPDTVIVKRDGDQLSVATIEVGSKAQSVVAGGDGVNFETLSEDKRAVACLTESEILRLARIGVAQEELWGAARDIEWAIVKDDIYLLQARPITSLERWTEEELLHEMDYPIMSDDELLTFANIGEVLPKPVSPLSFDLVNEPLEKGMGRIIISNDDGYDKSMVATHNRLALVLYTTTYRRVPEKLDIGIRMLEMSLHGHKVATDEILKTALHRRPSTFYFRIWMTLRMFKDLFWTKTYLKTATKRVKAMDLKGDTDDPLVLLDKLVSSDGDMLQVAMHHGTTSAVSSFSQFIAMSVLLEGKQDFTPEQCNEIGMLLSSGDVLSAEVPHELARLARQLDESGRMEDFRAQRPNEALAWLQNNLPQIHRNVVKFLDQHGYRAIMEFDLSTKPWALVPEELMSVLAQMRLSNDSTEEQRNKSDDEMLNSLKSPQKPITKKVLRWVLPVCRRAVRHREGTKAQVIRAVHNLRLATIRLGDLMVRRWLLPDRDLVFYFRVHELRRYIQTRDPLLLKKAIQRHQYYPKWAKLKFAELNTGWVEPLKELGPQITTGDVKLQATPACGGEVVARACVIKDLSQIGELKQGDVLITYSTDIGWSPYFPLLSGIVTELGGLISHGAVIAREYGLPCIVGAAHATDLFKSGDTVRLAGAAGTLETVHLAPDRDAES